MQVFRGNWCGIDIAAKEFLTLGETLREETEQAAGEGSAGGEPDETAQKAQVCGSLWHHVHNLFVMFTCGPFCWEQDCCLPHGV